MQYLSGRESYMETRREFIRKASLLSGMAGMQTLLPDSIQRALAIAPDPGSTWKDAEHIVILMQENRSFDHAFGSLKGVRGFNDPRAIRLPDGNPVWLQTNLAGNTFAPFRLNIKDTKSTWMSSLPHAWDNQVGARNNGRYDQWLNEKKNAIKEFSEMPLTMGFYNREDIPFYYALADAFTICDQHFCSSLTGTTPNRLFFWTGTIRAEQNEDSRAMVWNDDADYESLRWKTFPEILEEEGVSWKFYQNEISVNVGMTEEESRWLANFGDNPLEYFRQYNVRLHGKYMDQMQKLSGSLPGEISALQLKLKNLPEGDPLRNELQSQLKEKQDRLQEAHASIRAYEKKNFDKLSSREQQLHKRAFSTNSGDPHYHSLEEISYNDKGELRRLSVPKGDVFHQLREDVRTGSLPTVSWIAAPEHLCDHPSSAWFGAWYVSELMDILTQNPEVWKKTIFILTYDENDGYFDHVPPFVAPHPGKPETGKTSDSIDTRVDYVTVEQEKERKGFPVDFEGESPIGLGYRVPLIVASPWSRGGFVNSEVFDLTSTLRFLEEYLSAKKGKSIVCPPISPWRRAICGDLTSVFRPAGPDAASLPFLKRDAFVESVYNAKFKKLPDGYHALNKEEITLFKTDPYASPFMPVQEKGTKPSSGLFYELYANGGLGADRNSFEIRFSASNMRFRDKALGSPFTVYAPEGYLPGKGGFHSWAFAVKAGEDLDFSWKTGDFKNGVYHLDIYGPNGFFRSYRGSGKDPDCFISCAYGIVPGDSFGHLALKFENRSSLSLKARISDKSYGMTGIVKDIAPHTVGTSALVIAIPLKRSFGWYDLSVSFDGFSAYEQRFAGRYETGKTGSTDPLMGRTM